MRLQNIVLYLLLVVSGSIGIPISAPAQMVIDDSASLKGITSAKGVFLIDFTNPKKTAFYLKIIKGTHEGFVKQGVKL